MGTTVIGGVLAGIFIGVFFIPVIFYVVEQWSGARKARQAAGVPLAPAPAEGD
jgi:hypothetical protein